MRRYSTVIVRSLSGWASDSGIAKELLKEPYTLDMWKSLG
jgi:hypothetical protein